MQVITAIIEDKAFTARLQGDNLWHVTATDTVTGVEESFTATDHQFGAVMALAITGYYDHAVVNNYLYDLAEQVQTNVPPQLRLIP